MFDDDSTTAIQKFRLDAFRVSVETQLNASEGNVAGKGDSRACLKDINRSPAPSPSALQYVPRKITVLRPHPHQLSCSVCCGKCLSFA